MEKVIRETLDPESYTVVQGGVAESSMLLDQKWDKIFYTGGASVGKIIAKKAAETLTPVTLELGGNNPAILAKHADPRLAARRLLWAKMHNAGQVCVSQNYTMVDKDILPLFVAELKKAFEEFFPHGAQKSPDYARIINERQFKRLKKMLDESSGKILIGGTMDESDLFFEPTVVEVDSMHDSLIQEESFGPLMPILPVENLDEAIRIANEVDETPLGIYPFGNKAETNKGRFFPRIITHPLISFASPQFDPVWWRVRQRRLLPRFDSDAAIRRRWHQWTRCLPGQGIFRDFHAPPPRDDHTIVDRRLPCCALPALHSPEAEPVPLHVGRQGRL